MDWYHVQDSKKTPNPEYVKGNFHSENEDGEFQTALQVKLTLSPYCNASWGHWITLLMVYSINSFSLSLWAFSNNLYISFIHEDKMQSEMLNIPPLFLTGWTSCCTAPRLSISTWSTCACIALWPACSCTLANAVCLKTPDWLWSLRCSSPCIPSTLRPWVPSKHPQQPSRPNFITLGNSHRKY